MIDFTKYPINKFKAYGGDNGKKIAIEYDGEIYMLKLPPIMSATSKLLKNAATYKNACISEYLGCHIYESMGFDTQKTLYGKYLVDGKEKEAVACKDFSVNGYVLLEFSKLKNACFEKSNENSAGYRTELQQILDAIDSQQLVSAKMLKEYFWDMFIADAFLGNFDRHNGNWGILVNENLQKAEIAPVYDCGSCLYPQVNEKGMEEILSDPAEVAQRIFVFPTSAIKFNDKKINYFDFISNNINQDCTEALFRVIGKIDIDKIKAIINDTSFLSEIKKRFYITILEQRKERILDFSWKKINSFESKICSGRYRLSQLCDIAEEEFHWDKDTAKQRIQGLKKTPRYRNMECMQQGQAK
ncbi:MAG: HipA-like protein [Firmicutes bacterium]|nr:HipA-like protein [Bacillota bacterium]